MKNVLEILLKDEYNLDCIISYNKFDMRYKMVSLSQNGKYVLSYQTIEKEEDILISLYKYAKKHYLNLKECSINTY